MGEITKLLKAANEVFRKTGKSMDVYAIPEETAAKICRELNSDYFYTGRRFTSIDDLFGARLYGIQIQRLEKNDC